MTSPTITYLDGRAVQTTGFDARNLKEGDEVLVRATVQEDGVDADDDIQVETPAGWAYFKSEDVLGVVVGAAPEEAPKPPPQRFGDVAKDLRVGQRVRVTYEGVVGDLDETDPRLPVRIDLDGGDAWEWPTASAMVEVLPEPEQPLAVGDRIWHRDVPEGESRKIEAITQIGGVDHLLFKPFGRTVDVPLVAYPAADYVRAR